MVAIGILDTLEYMGVKFFDKRRLLFWEYILDGLGTHFS